MSTMTIKRKATGKPLRIRPELLPESAKYGTFDGEEYVMIPVKDFGDWYEDVEDGIIVEERRKFDDGPCVSLEDLQEEIRREKTKRP